MPQSLGVGHSRLGDELQSLCKEGQLGMALDVLRRMDQKGTLPQLSVYGSLLRACTKRKDLESAKRVHTHLAQHGLELSKFLGENLVSTYVKCGGLEEALRIFYRLPHRGVFSWTAIMSGYVMSGQAEEALRMYHWMQREGVRPDTYTFVSLLKACGSLGDLQEAKRIHAEGFKHGCQADLFVGTCLVDMYGKCGSIVDAQFVFDGLSEPDVVTWNAMLAAYVQQGLAEKALQLYEQMQQEEVRPTNRTFVSALQACGMLAEKNWGNLVDVQSSIGAFFEQGKAIHADVSRKGCGSDAFVGSTLVSMYGKWGSITDAQIVFDRLDQDDVVAWNAMLGAYVDEGQAEKAVQLYERMFEEGMDPNSRTFVIILRAFSMLAETEVNQIINGKPTKLKYLERGKSVHAGVFWKSCNIDLFVGSTLVSMYGKCGSIADAQTVFDGMSQRNLVLWNAMLTAYLEQGLAEKALQLFEQMWDEGVSSDAWVIVSALQACGMLAENEEDIVVDEKSVWRKSLRRGMAIHDEARKKGYDSDTFVGNTLVSMYGKCGSVVDAHRVFDGLAQRDLVSWNALISAYIEQDQAEKALELYDLMQEEGRSPDNHTFVSMLRACSILAGSEGSWVVDAQVTKEKCLEQGRSIHDKIWRKGYSSDVLIGNSLVNMYGKCGSVADAQKVFNELFQRDVVAWTSMIAAYVEQGQGDKALQVYEEMQQSGQSPDQITVLLVLRACSNTGSLGILRKLHLSLLSRWNKLSSPVSNTLISAYGSCSSMVDAQVVFDALPVADVVSWNALIASYARQGNYTASFRHYERMRLAGVTPNTITFLSLLSACTHAGLVDKGLEYFESMSKDHGIAPETEHYASMIDLLGGAGLFLRIEDLLSTIPIQPTLSMWLCLLGACRKHGKVELAERAFDCALRVQPKHAAAHLMMAAIYADAGDFEGANVVTKAIKKGVAWKEPGQSWMEHAGERHIFLVGDSNKTPHKQLHQLLKQASLKLYEGHLETVNVNVLEDTAEPSALCILSR